MTNIKLLMASAEHVNALVMVREVVRRIDAQDPLSPYALEGIQFAGVDALTIRSGLLAAMMTIEDKAKAALVALGVSFEEDAVKVETTAAIGASGDNRTAEARAAEAEPTPAPEPERA